MAINDEAKESVENAAPVTPGAGLNPNDPAAVARINDALKMRGGDVFRSTLMGAGMGAQAAQGAVNPLVAFIQGAAAGLQAPAQIFAEKRAQIKSAMDATPFGVIVPEAMNPDSPYHVLSGIPYALAVGAIEGISRDAVKINAESQAQKAEIKGKYIQAGEDAENAARILQENDPEHKPRSAKSLVGFLREDLDALIKTKTGTTTIAPTIGSAATDRAFAQEYSSYLAGGGYADTQNQIKSLEDAKNQLESGGQYTGFFTNLFSGNIINPKAKALQQQIESSVQRTLKQTLGGQFTEKEGQLFMQRGFDPKLSEAQNIKKLTRMIDQLKIMDIAKREAIDYFAEHGTLEGYRGKYYTINDGKIVDVAQKSTGLTPEEEAELAELEKKASKK